MPWQKTRADRERDKSAYGSPEYKRNRAAARRRANGRCEECGHPHSHLQCDHITPLSQHGTHHLDNLRMLCSGEGSCQCHDKKTATEGGGYRRKGRAKAEDPPLQGRTRW